MRIKNWDRWQSYRTDRGTPPWIKVHRNLMSNQEWVQLTDAEKGQLVSIWILAADKGGIVPDNATMIQKMCMLDEQPNLNKFIELGFIVSDGSQDDANVASERQPDDAPETETEAEALQRQSTTTSLSSRKSDPVPYQQIVDLYHEMLPALPKVAKLTSTRKGYIRQRWKEDMDDLKNWSNFFEYVADSDFLMGRSKSNGDRPPFVANLEWLCRPSNFVKIAEGKYHV